jgi:hypothetical protein
MLKISFSETSTERRMTLKGQMIGTEVRQLRTICTRVRNELDGRLLVIDIKGVALINQEGENLLFELINWGAKLRPEGALAQGVVQQLAKRSKKQASDLIDSSLNDAIDEERREPPPCF